MEPKKFYDLPKDKPYTIIKPCRTESHEQFKRTIWTWSFRKGKYMCSVCGELSE